MSINFNNRAKYKETVRGYEYYDWDVFVDEPEDVLEKIDYVVYYLHETFPDPVRTVAETKSAFALKSRGWGEFSIKIEVHFKDGNIENTKYWLDLSKPWN
jgi:transcription initiation factor IIF auxiliary subunit